MSFFRVKALRRIARGPLTLRELAELLLTDRPYTTLVVDDLAGRGLVERSANPADRRSKIVTVTPAGRAAAERAERILGTPRPRCSPCRRRTWRRWTASRRGSRRPGSRTGRPRTDALRPTSSD
ncbi:MarR family transcriptional regulator [Streptomyces stramineus]